MTCRKRIFRNADIDTDTDLAAESDWQLQSGKDKCGNEGEEDRKPRGTEHQHHYHYVDGII